MPYDPKNFDINIPLRHLRQESEVPMRDNMIEYYHNRPSIEFRPTLKISRTILPMRDKES